MTRVKVFRSLGPGGESVVDQIHKCISANARELCLRGIAYKSRDMKTGVVIAGREGLEHWSCSIAAAMELDGRGGHFDQVDVEQAFQLEYEKEDYAASVLQLAAQAGSSFAVFIFIFFDFKRWLSSNWACPH